MTSSAYGLCTERSKHRGASRVVRCSFSRASVGCLSSALLPNGSAPPVGRLVPGMSGLGAVPAQPAFLPRNATLLHQLQAIGQGGFLHTEAAFNRAFGDRLNPFYHLGEIAFFLFWVVVASGATP